MTTIKAKFRASAHNDCEGTIYFQIIHERKTRQLLTNYRVYPSEWDERRSLVVTSDKNERNMQIRSIRDHIRCDEERLIRIIRKFESKCQPYAAENVIDEFKRHCIEYSMFNFMERIINKLKSNGKLRTSETYMSALNSFKKFRKNEDIILDCLTSEIMEGYEAWLRKRGVSFNTISFYTRILRAVYNRAVEEGIIENRRPFRHVYTGIEKTVKRALPLAVIRRIKLLDLSQTPALDFARDIFMLSFYLRGMSFIDMAFLGKMSLKNGYITYRRRKTGQLLTIEWTKEMQSILDKYPVNESDYLLPIIKVPCKNERSAYKNVGYNINHNLKTIAGMVGVSMPLTLYVARHSWASAAKAKGIPVSVISEGMGHDSEATTQIYLASLDTSVVDKANSLIIRCLM